MYAKGLIPRSHNGGFGVLEALFSMVLLTILAVTVVIGTAATRSNMEGFDKKVTCSEITRSVNEFFKSRNNNLTVRNWLPSALISRPFANSLDPLCHTDANNWGCDTLNHFRVNIGGTPEFRNFQNVRNSAAWAQSIYNQMKPTICTNKGIRFTPQEFAQIIPANVILPNWVSSIDLFIIERGAHAVQCGETSTSGFNSDNRFDIQMEINEVENEHEQATCGTEFAVAYGSDVHKPKANLTLTNGADANVLAGGVQCTCSRTVDQLSGGVCPEMTTLKLSLESSEPGTMFLCSGSTDGTAWAEGHCGQVTSIGGQAPSLSPDLSRQPTYNQATRVTYTWNDLQVSSVPYQLKVKSVDVAGNFVENTVSFLVSPPSCPQANTYCGTATSTGTGILHRPTDSCGNGLCPVGTRAGQNCPDMTNVCPGQPALNDDCGNNVCVGQRVARGCQAPENVCAGTPIADDCGNFTCPVGSKPPKASCPDINTFCGTPTPLTDGCGNGCDAGIYCPPSTPAPTPTPTPTPSPSPTPDPCTAGSTTETVVDVTFPNPGGTCAWSQNGNLAARDTHFQARIEQSRTFTLPPQSKLCSLRFEFNPQSFIFDDQFIFTLNDKILAASINYTTIFSGSGTIYTYDWNQIVGRPWSSTTEGVYCTGTGSVCSWPSTDSAGTINMQFTPAHIQNIMSVDPGRTSHTFGIVTTGDNDAVDCRHSHLEFRVRATYSQ